MTCHPMTAPTNYSHSDTNQCAMTVAVAEGLVMMRKVMRMMVWMVDLSPLSAAVAAAAAAAAGRDIGYFV